MFKNILSSLSFVSALIYVFIGVYAYRQHKKSKSNKVFLVLCMVYALWSFSYGFVYIASNLHIFYFWNKLAAIGWCSVGAMALYFVLVLTKTKFIDKTGAKFLLFLPAVVLFIMATTLFGPETKTPKLIDDLFYTIDFLYNFSYLLISILIVFIWGLKAKSKRVKLQSKIIVLSSSIPFIISFVVQRLLGFAYNIHIPNIDQIYSVFTITGIYMAISKYKFLQLPEKFILDEVVNEMMDMFILLDEDGQIIKISKHALEMLMYEENELLKSELKVILNNENSDNNNNDNGNNNYIEKENSCYGSESETIGINLKDLGHDNRKYKNINLQKKNGEKIPVNISCKQIYDDRVKAFIGVILVIQDISMYHEMAIKNDELQATIEELRAIEEELRYQYDLNLENEQLISNSEAKFRTIFNDAPLGINLSDSITGQFYETNSKYAEITGRTVEEILNTNWMAITHPNDIKVNSDFEKNLAGKFMDNYNINKRYLKPDGSVVWVNMTVANIKLEGKSNPCEVCMVEDITEKKLNEEALKASEYTFRKLFEDSSDPILLMDGNKIIDCNPATMRALGYANKLEIVDKAILEISPQYQPDGVPSVQKYEIITKELDKNGNLKFEWWHRKSNGEVYPVEIMLTTILLNGKKVFHALCRDISERKQMEQKLEYLNYHDQLTGLYNRRFFEEELIRLDVPRNYPLAIVMADVNGLKLINDTFGHVTGDELLKKVSMVIMKGCRADDIVARLGGDEFIMLLPKTDAVETDQIIKRIKNISSNEKVGSIAISVSFGYQIKNSINEKNLEILKKAEDIMYKNKLFEGPSMRSQTMNTIISTLHEKNKREEQHSHRVSSLCKIVGKELGLEDSLIDELITVGLFHDIGKIAIDENILNKPGRLTPEEWEEIKRHPEIGYRILSTVNEMSDMAEYVLDHHERWDGSGYPKGLKGLEIPLASRIITVIDAYDAMTSERSYRPALGEDVAIEELRKYSGIQFDPDIVTIFIDKVLVCA